MTFAEELRRAMAARGVNNRDLGTSTGTTGGYISNLRRDKQVCSHDLAVKMADLLMWPSLVDISTRNRTRRCPVCDREFLRSHSAQTRCSPSCSKADDKRKSVERMRKKSEGWKLERRFNAEIVKNRLTVHQDAVTRLPRVRTGRHLPDPAVPSPRRVPTPTGPEQGCRARAQDGSGMTDQSAVKCRRHVWGQVIAPDDCQFIGGGQALIVETRCTRCKVLYDEVKSRRGRNARRRGNSLQAKAAKDAGIQNIGALGLPEDAGNSRDWLVIQHKSGAGYPRLLDRWLRALTTTADQLRGVVYTETPGTGRKAKRLITCDYDEFLMWFGGNKR